MPHEIAGVTICNLPHPTRANETCGQKFYGPQHLTIGAVNGGRVQALLEKMYRHLFQDHQQHFANIQAHGEGLKGLLVMAAFTTQDPDLQAQANHLRWTIHQQTLNARITDEQLKEAAEQFAAHLCGHGDIVGELERLDFVTWQQGLDLIRTLLVKRIEPELRCIRDALQEPAEPPNPLAPAVATQ